MTNNTFKNIKEFSEYLFSINNVIIFTHERPDGDAVGSVFALQKAFLENHKKADVFFQEELPAAYKHLINENVYISKKRENHSYDYCIALDSGSFERLSSFHDSQTSLHNITTINIDHHPDNTFFGTHNFVVPSACATAEIIFDIFTSIPNWKITIEIANCLLMGILLDTGGLRFANTNANVLHKTANLIELGAQYSNIVKEMYFSSSLNLMKLKADAILNHLKILFNKEFAYLYLSEDLLNKYDVKYKDTEGVIDYIRTIKGLNIASVISKVKDGFKISLRSNNQEFPVNTIAHKISGGGGHKLAAGCTVKTNSFEQAEQILLKHIKELLKKFD